MNMFRLLKALPLALAIVAIVALGVFAASCGNSGNAEVRVVNAIPDAPAALDIDVNGDKDFPNIQFGNVYPTPSPSGPATYTSVVSGSVTIEGYDTGTTTVAVAPTTANLSASTEYTMLLGGFFNSSPSAFVITDNNTVPVTGNVNLRIINGSAISGSNGIDVCIAQNGLPFPSPCQVSGLSLGASSSYLPMTFESSYSFEVFFHGNGNPQFTYTPPTGLVTGEIMTLVIVDEQNGQEMSDFPIVLVDVD
jgi:hypothetical protein